MKQVKVLMVCLGNICRSPTAHGVFEAVVTKRGLADHILVDSAGTADWNVGKSPDPRTAKAALTRGYDLSTQCGRQVSIDDFREYDYILPMDRQNLIDLQAICPEGFSGHMGLFLEFSRKQTHLEVPDPYLGESDDFELVLDLVEEAVEGLLEDILEKHPQIRAYAT